MALYTSDRFASASATGTDWRDTSRAVLELLEKAAIPGHDYTIGFLYISDELVEDAASILNLFRAVTNIEHWVGATGLGVCATSAEYVESPAIAAMIGRMKDSDFCVFPALKQGTTTEKLEKWTDHHDPMLVLVHGDPQPDTDPATALETLEFITQGFITGGMSSSRSTTMQFADEISQGNISGVAFSQDIDVATTLTQGCAPIGTWHRITRCEDNVIMELDGQRVFEIFSSDLRDLAVSKGAAEENEDTDIQETLFRGEVHVAFPVQGSDQKDYLVRNIVGIDPEKGWISVGHPVMNGEQMMFVHRNNQTVRTDLSRALLEIRSRLETERGSFKPQGALYISCMARAQPDFGVGPGGEMALVREIIGDIPLAGFYANGEISNRRFYGYTAILILFL